MRQAMKRGDRLLRHGAATLSCFYWWGRVWSETKRVKKMILYNSLIIFITPSSV